MDDYTKAMKIQELREQRVDLMWEFICSVEGITILTDIYNKVQSLDKQIKELQNG